MTPLSIKVTHTMLRKWILFLNIFTNCIVCTHQVKPYYCSGKKD